MTPIISDEVEAYAKSLGLGEIKQDLRVATAQAEASCAKHQLKGALHAVTAKEDSAKKLAAKCKDYYSKYRKLNDRLVTANKKIEMLKAKLKYEKDNHDIEVCRLKSEARELKKSLKLQDKRIESFKKKCLSLSECL